MANSNFKFLKDFFFEKGSQGFASMDTEKQRMIASKGGRAAHKMGKAHEWTSYEAKLAGQKGGKKKDKARRG